MTENDTHTTTGAGTPGPEPEQARARSLNQSWISRGLVIRVVAYTVGAHVFAGFLYLLFTLGAGRTH